MKNLSGLRVIGLSGLLLGGCLMAQDAAVPLSGAGSVEAGASLARIVRLSQVKGEVKLDRNTSHGFETAFANLPITQGLKLKTAEGVAEVEFEDNSSLRLVTDTAIEFPTLQSGPGGMNSAVRLLNGTLYVSLAKTKGNQFAVVFGPNRVALNPASHILLSVYSTSSKLTVLSGTVAVTNASGTTVAGKKKTLLFDPVAEMPPVTVAKAEETPFDTWDKNSVDFHQVRGAAAYGNSGAVYGISDLNYYGAFSDVGGCGAMWRPYLANAAWDPFANGTWAYYPGAGYSWVSPYPWGWMPFHYGSWSNCGGGWGWQPGGSWVGLPNHRLLPGPTRCPHCVKPPQPSAPGRATLVAVNAKPLAVSGAAAATPESFVLRAGSAGIGVPRGAFGSLHSMAHDVAAHGTVTVPVYAPGGGGMQAGAMRGSGTATGSSRGSGTASAPASSGSFHSSGGGSMSSVGAIASSSGAMSSPSAGSMSGSAGGSAGGHH